MPFEIEEEEKFSIRDGDVIICEGGEAGRAAVWSGPDIGVKFQKAIHRVRPGPALFNRFLVHQLFYDYHSGALSDYYTGATISHLTGQDLARYEIALPPLDEQRRIVAILDQVDNLRRKRQEFFARAEELIRADFGRISRCPGDEQSTIMLDDIAEIIMGQSPEGASYNSTGAGTPLLNGPTEFGTEHPAEVQWTTAPTKLSRSGDILFCVRGATAGRLNWSDKSYCCGRGIAAIRPKDTGDGAFIYGCLEANYAYFQARGVGSTFINISKEELGRFTLPNVPVAARVTFSERAREVRKIKNNCHAHLAKLDALFASLQHRAFRGEL
jgi:type I restriction enzyme S subunit